MNPDPRPAFSNRSLMIGLVAVLSFFLFYTFYAWGAQFTRPPINRGLILAERLIYALVFVLLAWFWFERFLPRLFLFDAGSFNLALWRSGSDLRSRLRSIGMAIGVGLVSFAGMMLYDFFLRPDFSPAADRAHIRAGLGDIPGLLFTLGVSALLTPLLEETFYRGILTRFLLGRGLPVWFALPVQALCFGAAHPPDVWPLIVCLGLVLGVLFWRSGLVAGVVAHSVYNACILLYTFFAPAG